MLRYVLQSTTCTLILLGLVVSGPEAFGFPPTLHQDVVYRIHEDNKDPNSAVTFTIMLSLKSCERDGDMIGWEIKSMRFRQPGENGDTIWTESDPNVATPDGLWWTEHTDASDPQLAEFDDPPHLVGTATAHDPNDANLKYDFEGDDYTGTAPWDPTAGLEYEFTLASESTPFLEGDDEPVEVDDESDPDE